MVTKGAFLRELIKRFNTYMEETILADKRGGGAGFF